MRVRNHAEGEHQRSYLAETSVYIPGSESTAASSLLALSSRNSTFERSCRCLTCGCGRNK